MSSTAKSKKSDETPNAGQGLEMADAGSMDKIRDILFGNQARDYENRFIQMEEQLTREAADLRQELVKRIDTLESYIKQEIKDINQRIIRESQERSDTADAIRKEIKENVESLNKKLLNDEENLARKTTELREQILEQSKTLSAEILSKYEQTSTDLKKSAAALDDAKVNRSDLSGFFLEIAMRLSGDDQQSQSRQAK